jgi:hypothetical protein
MVEEPRIKTLSTIRLIGHNRRMSVANNQTKGALAILYAAERNDQALDR